MRILYLLQDFPYPPTNGIRVKVFNLIKYMAQEHECHILSFDGYDALARAEEFRHQVPAVKILGLFPRRSGFRLQLARLKHLVCGNPPFLARWDNEAFAQAIRRSLDSTDYDLVHLDALGVAPYLQVCNSKPTVLSTTDAVSRSERRAAAVIRNPIRRAYRRLAAQLTAGFEHRWLPRATKVHVVSETDHQYLKARILSVDLDFIELPVPDDVITYPLNTCTETIRFPRLLFSGLLSIDGIAEGLLQFLSNAYPRILATVPGVQLTVVGRYAPARVRKQVHDAPNTHFLEWVDDYLAEIAKSQVVIVPDLAGTGIKTRVLYAFALAKPVVGTHFALEGIPVRDGIHCFIRSSWESFSEAVITLLQDEDLERQMGNAARELVLKNYTLEVIGAKWVELYQAAIAKFHRTR